METETTASARNDIYDVGFNYGTVLLEFWLQLCAYCN